jgi:hypothetical protein
MESDLVANLRTQVLFSGLGESGRDVFRALHAEYERDWKFRGRV